MSLPVFSIKDLTCAYQADKPVLQLEELELARGQLIFVIGRSGIGKSTFIETLGLMNRTIMPAASTELLFYPKDDAGAEMELKASWSLPNEQRADFRRHHFSFIFQNTNLMPNFTAGENMMISLLINGVKRVRAEEEVRKIMRKLSLDDEVFDKKITELSGGQRQRLAFVRAVTRDFTVLYGDEPTGNLDENTAADLMRTLKAIIKEEQKTGIIVSHDLSLACEFADMIIPIALDTERSTERRSVGKISNEHILYSKDGTLCNVAGEAIETPLAYLNQFLKVKAITQ